MHVYTERSIFPCVSNKFLFGFLSLTLVFFGSQSAFAVPIDLNFGNSVQPDFGNGMLEEMQFTDVAAGIDATITPDAYSRTNFTRSSRYDRNGSVNDDLRMSMDRDQFVTFTLNLWDAGTNFATPYDSTGLQWNFVIYDIDGSSFNGSWDSLSFDTSQGTYATSETSVLNISETGGVVTFTGEGTGGVAGEGGLSPPLTQAQIDHSVLFTTNLGLSAITFTYEGVGGVREMLMDGGSLGSIVQIPEPGTVTLLGIGLIGMFLLRRRKPLGPSV